MRSQINNFAQQEDRKCVTFNTQSKQKNQDKVSTFESYFKLQSNTPIQFQSNGLFQNITYQNKGHYWGTVKVNSDGFQRHGFGRYDYCNGGVYDGQWKDDNMSGYGQLYYPGGLLAYEGEWLDDKFHGLGAQYNNTIEYNSINYLDFNLIGENWSRYEGQLEKDKRHGFGKLILCDGSFYQGSFLHDVPDGKGLVYQKNKVQSSLWNLGKAHQLTNIKTI